MSTDTIWLFSGRYEFLSNFYPLTHGVRIPDDIERIYPSVENAFQASKTLLKEDRLPFLAYSPAKAKREGKLLQKRQDWEEIKIEIMTDLVRQKFCNNADLAAKLILTSPRTLVEGNSWGDMYWGVDLRSKRGLNYLGQILMKVREETIHEQVYKG